MPYKRRVRRDGVMEKSYSKDKKGRKKPLLLKNDSTQFRSRHTYEGGGGAGQAQSVIY